MKITAQVTRYNVNYVDNPRGELHKITSDEETTIEARYGWIFIGNCAGSMPVDRIPEAIERDGWYADASTEPVYVEPCPHPRESHGCCGRECQSPYGGWGGRNYPRVFVPATELERVQKELGAHEAA